MGMRTVHDSKLDTIEDQDSQQAGEGVEVVDDAQLRGVQIRLDERLEHWVNRIGDLAVGGWLGRWLIALVSQVGRLARVAWRGRAAERG
jgi:hypothetical protein